MAVTKDRDPRNPVDALSLVPDIAVAEGGTGDSWEPAPAWPVVVGCLAAFLLWSGCMMYLGAALVGFGE